MVCEQQWGMAETSSVFLVCGTTATTSKENISGIPWETSPRIQAQNCLSKILEYLILSAKIARSTNVSKVFNFYDFVKNWWVSRVEMEKYVIYSSSIGKEMETETQHLSGMFDHGPLDQGQMQLQRSCRTCQALPCWEFWERMVKNHSGRHQRAAGATWVFR